VRLSGTCWEPLKTAGQPSSAGAAWITSSGPHRPKQTSKLGGALNECCLNEVDLTPAASTTCERSAMLAHPSTELVVRAPCQLRRAHARSVRAARARLRPSASRSAASAALKSTRRASATFKRGAPEAPSRGDDAGTLKRALFCSFLHFSLPYPPTPHLSFHFFSRGRLPSS